MIGDRSPILECARREFASGPGGGQAGSFDAAHERLTAGVNTLAPRLAKAS